MYYTKFMDEIKRLYYKAKHFGIPAKNLKWILSNDVANALDCNPYTLFNKNDPTMTPYLFAIPVEILYGQDDFTVALAISCEEMK
jgi:hypothetical protein